MKRTTITLPDDLAELVAHEARRMETSVSEVIRLAVSRMFLSGTREIPWAGICDAADLPPASTIDEALQEEWSDDLDRNR